MEVISAAYRHLQFDHFAYLCTRKNRLCQRQKNIRQVALQAIPDTMTTVPDRAVVPVKHFDI